MHANRILSGDSLGETAQAAAREDLNEADRSALLLVTRHMTGQGKGVYVPQTIASLQALTLHSEWLSL